MELGDQRKLVVKWALISRSTLISLQIVSNFLITDHDAKVFISPKAMDTQTFLDGAINFMFGGFVRWDAQYFTHIATYGYTFENTLAFFPLYPFIVRASVSLVSPLMTFVSLDSTITCTCVVLNLVLFVQSALLLYSITEQSRNDSFAQCTVFLFCFNPASIFFSAPYSECLFFYLTLKSIHCCTNLYKEYITSGKVQQFKTILPCIIYISLSTTTRSNGLLNICFFVYFYVRILLYKLKFWDLLENVKFSSYKLMFRNLSKTIQLAGRPVAVLMFYVVLMLVPFTTLQLYDYQMFCTDFNANVPQFLIDFANSNKFVLPGRFSQHNQSWCYDKLPLAYAYVQRHYWNVGFLKYYEYKQIPNFLLAVPVVLIVLNHSLHFTRKFVIDFKKLMINHYSLLLENEKLLKDHLWENIQFVCVIHVTVLTIFCILCVHVQVTTRMIYSATPIIYWISAECFVFKKDSVEKKFTIWYYASYYVIGTVMFCNFLPWT